MTTPKLDLCSLIARYYPAILTSVPMFVLWFFLVKDAGWNDLLQFICSVKFIGTVSISAIALFMYSMVIREVSKYFQRAYFTNARGFPTTYLLLYSDKKLSEDVKTRFRAKVKSSFKIELLNEKEENSIADEAAKRITEAVDQVRTRVGSGKLVLHHNIWFGFWRNLIGGCAIAGPFALVDFLLGRYLFLSIPMMAISAALLGIYSTIFLFRRQILINNGEAYARQLITEFMSPSLKTKD